MTAVWTTGLKKQLTDEGLISGLLGATLLSCQHLIILSVNNLNFGREATLSTSVDEINVGRGHHAGGQAAIPWDTDRLKGWPSTSVLEFDIGHKMSFTWDGLTHASVYRLGITQTDSSSVEKGLGGLLDKLIVNRQCALVVMKANCIRGCQSKSRASTKMVFSLYLPHLKLRQEFCVHFGVLTASRSPKSLWAEALERRTSFLHSFSIFRT